MLRKAVWKTTHNVSTDEQSQACFYCDLCANKWTHLQATCTRNMSTFFSISIALCVYTERGRSVNMLEWKQHETLRNRGRIKTNKDGLSESTLQEWQSAGFCWSWQWRQDYFWPRWTFHQESQLPASHWTTKSIYPSNTNMFIIS